MSDLRTLLERGVGGVTPPPEAFERMLGRRDRKRRRQRIAAVVVSVAVAAAVAFGLSSLRLLRSEDDLGSEPRSVNGPLTVFSDAGIRTLPLDGSPAQGREGDPFRPCGPRRCGLVLDSSWTADGSRLAYADGCAGVCSEPPSRFGIWVVDADGTRERLPIGSPSSPYPSRDVPVLAPVIALDWSPTGDRLAFVDAGGSIHVWHDRTSSVTPVPGAFDAESISWSPVGDLLAYGTTAGEIEVIGTDGSPVARLGGGRQPEWSPDGEMIAYREGCEVGTVRIDDRRRSVLATFPEALWGHASRLSCSPHVDLLQALGPVWSPDGEQLAAVFANRVYVIDAETGATRIVQDPIQRSLGGSGAGVEWQPVPAPSGG